jgi:serine-type D-Ala-D-Ala carboxypeptidase (penicillin-binding protein 5/6)
MSPANSIAIIIAIAILAMTPLIPSMSGTSRTDKKASLYASLGQEEFSQTKNSEPSLSTPTIEAVTAIVFNPTTEEVLFGKNEHQVFGIASLTKIMTAIIALENTGANELIRISVNAVATEGIAGNINPGEHFRLNDLIAMMMIESSNDAAVSIAEHIGSLHGGDTFDEQVKIFVSLMNEKAFELGLRDTLFQNPTGLDVDEDAGIISNISTAHDVAQFTAYARQYPAIWEFSRMAEYTAESFEGVPHKLSAINPLPQEIPGIVGGKTGFTDSTQGSLVSLAEIPLGNQGIIVVLGSSRDGRFTDTLLLADWLRNN